VSLRTRWEESLPEKRRRQLSNADDTGSLSQNDTVVDRACVRVKAFIRIFAGLDYDAADGDNDERIWTVAVDGVTVLLQRQNGAAERKEQFAEWKLLVKDLAKVTSRNRVKPTTSSKLTPTPEVQSGQIVRPDFDRPKFNRAVPDNNGDTQDRITMAGD
jgi:hypothetical protein